MKKLIVFVMAVLLVGLPVLASASEQHPTKDEVKAFVDKAVSYAKVNGKEQALKEFMNPQGEFFRGELYIFTYDYDGNVISHGAKPALVGKNLLRLKDAKGLSVIEELRNIAGGGEGWVWFYSDNPVEKKVIPKMGYVVKVDDSWWLGSGMYEEE